jgi:hypothetical protein
MRSRYMQTLPGADAKQQMSLHGVQIYNHKAENEELGKCSTYPGKRSAPMGRLEMHTEGACCDRTV